MEHEIGHRIRASRWSSILLITSLTTLVVASAGLFLFARDPYSAAEIRRLIEQGYNTQRPGGGRLYKAAYSRLDDSPIAQTELGKAQLLLLRHPDLETKHRLQGVLYLASGDWQKYVEAVPHLSTSQRGEPSVLNDLGVSYLALSDKDPSYLLNALEQFERAAQLSPKATAPRFNLVITYRRLHFHDLADKALENYKLIEAGSPWYRELTGRNSRDKSLLLDQLRLAVVRNDIRDAARLVQQDPDFFLHVLRQYGAANAEESPNVVHFIASEMDKRYGDKTFSAMLAPLFTDQRQTIIALRQFVTEGAELFVKGDLDGSLRAYAKADQLAEHTDSLFDALWIDLNRVDTQIRAGEFESAHEALERIVSLSRKNEFRWLTAKGLSIYGSSKRLTASFREMMDFVAEANHLF